jgi:hypothetical protein
MNVMNCYQLMPEERPDKDDSTRVTFVPSGFTGVWLLVTEDPAYNISVTYATTEQVKRLKAVAKEKGIDLD